jgi:hypothetical protein
MCGEEEQFLDGCMRRILGRCQLWNSLRGEKTGQRRGDDATRGEKRGDERKEGRDEIRDEG